MKKLEKAVHDVLNRGLGAAVEVELPDWKITHLTPWAPEGFTAIDTRLWARSVPDRLDSIEVVHLDWVAVASHRGGGCSYNDSYSSCPCEVDDDYDCTISHTEQLLLQRTIAPATIALAPTVTLPNLITVHALANGTRHEVPESHPALAHTSALIDLNFALRDDLRARFGWTSLDCPLRVRQRAEDGRYVASVTLRPRDQGWSVYRATCALTDLATTILPDAAIAVIELDPADPASWLRDPAWMRAGVDIAALRAASLAHEQ